MVHFNRMLMSLALSSVLFLSACQRTGVPNGDVELSKGEQPPYTVNLDNLSKPVR